MRDESGLLRDPPVFGTLALAVLGLVFLQPIAGTLRLWDLSAEVLTSRPGLILALSSALLLAAPLLVHAATRALGGKANWKVSGSGGWLILFVFALLSFAAARVMAAARVNLLLDTALMLPFAAAAAYFLFRFLRGVHGLGTGAAFVLATSAVAAATSLHLYTAVSFLTALRSDSQERMERAYAHASWPAEIQPNREAGKAAAQLYARAAALTAAHKDWDSTRVIEAVESPDPFLDAKGEWASLLKSNAAALAVFRHAAQNPYCDFSTGETVFTESTGWPKLQAQFYLFRLLLLDARLQESRGRDDQAVEDYADALAFARHLAQQRSPTWQYYFFTDMVLREQNALLLRRIAHGRGSPQSAKRLLSAVAAVRAARAPLADALSSSWLQSGAEFGIVWAEACRHVRPALCEASSPDAARRWKEAGEQLAAISEQNRPEDLESYGRTILRDYPWPGQPTQRLAVCITRPGNLGACQSATAANYPFFVNHPFLLESTIHLIEAELNLIEAGFAVRLYASRHGHPPADLAALSPEFLPTVPADPFDDFKPLRYSTGPGKTWTLYSFGPDRADDGAAKAYDVTWVPNAPPIRTGDVILRAMN